MAKFKHYDYKQMLMVPVSLEEYIHVCAQNMSPAHYQKVLDVKTLKRALFGFGSDNKNNKMKEMMASKGIKAYRHQPLKFVG
jgi:hypothetical protein